MRAGPALPLHLMTDIVVGWLVSSWLPTYVLKHIDLM